ncbi:helix-turn-helix transcriptional regulator [Streptomyces sp. NPDC086023]|uniref:helix-turn-helix transcriptional regulator n=1 Tax=Streptomyces sp. NPDC086023 TaxID=3365746 RepID=UPI0037D5A3E3
MPSAPSPEWFVTRRQTIGARVRAAREAADLTQEELGERVGIDNKTVHRIEYAITDPTLTMLLRIARAVGVPLSQLVRE